MRIRITDDKRQLDDDLPDDAPRGRAAMLSRMARNGAEALRGDGSRDADGHEFVGRSRWLNHTAAESRRTGGGEA